MKNTEIKYYPDALVYTSQLFLHNSSLLKVFIYVVFEKTNVYDSSALCVTMELIEKWFKYME